MPSQKKRPVALTSADREALTRVTRTGAHPSPMIRRARVLLALDTSTGQVGAKEEIAARLDASGETLRLVAERFAETGGDIWTTIARKQRAQGVLTKPRLAEAMIARTLQAGGQAGWVAADSAYGRDGRSRPLSGRRRMPYVVEVPVKQTVADTDGRRRADTLIDRAPEKAWHRVPTGTGVRGERAHD